MYHNTERAETQHPSPAEAGCEWESWRSWRGARAIIGGRVSDRPAAGTPTSSVARPLPVHPKIRAAKRPGTALLLRCYDNHNRWCWPRYRYNQRLDVDRPDHSVSDTFQFTGSQRCAGPPPLPPPPPPPPSPRIRIHVRGTWIMTSPYLPCSLYDYYTLTFTD